MIKYNKILRIHKYTFYSSVKYNTQKMNKYFAHIPYDAKGCWSVFCCVDNIYGVAASPFPTVNVLRSYNLIHLSLHPTANILLFNGFNVIV